MSMSLPSLSTPAPIPDLVIHSVRERTKQLQDFCPKPLPKSIYKTCAVPEILSKPHPCDSLELSTNMRRQFEPALHAVLKAIALEFFRPLPNTLEIGAGMLHSKTRESYLSPHLALGTNHAAWTFSDAASIAAASQKSKPRKKYVTFDLTQKRPAQLKLASFERVVGCNVLDTLPYDELPHALKTIHALLKPGGLFIHLADLGPFSNAFVDACAVDNVVLLPAYPHSMAAIYQVDLDTYTETLHEKKASLDPKDYHFLEWWGGLPSQIQGVVLAELAYVGVDFSALVQRVESLFTAVLMRQERAKCFEKHLKAALPPAEWTIVDVGTRTQTVVNARKQTSDSNNYHSAQQGYISHMQCCVLHPDVDMYEATLDCFVARKNS